MDFIEVIDSTTFRLSKIDPNTGEVAFISPFNIEAGGNLTGGAFIEPNTMTYFFNHGNQIIGVSLITGLITSSVVKSYPSDEIAFDMMRSTQNCYGAAKMRNEVISGTDDFSSMENDLVLFPNPVQNELSISTKATLPVGLFHVFDKRPQIIIIETGIWDRPISQDEVKWEQNLNLHLGQINIDENKLTDFINRLSKETIKF